MKTTECVNAQFYWHQRDGYCASCLSVKPEIDAIKNIKLFRANGSWYVLDSIDRDADQRPVWYHGHRTDENMVRFDVSVTADEVTEEETPCNS